MDACLFYYECGGCKTFTPSTRRLLRVLSLRVGEVPAFAGTRALLPYQIGYSLDADI
jgi:hypothetical protein